VLQLALMICTLLAGLAGGVAIGRRLSPRARTEQQLRSLENSLASAGSGTFSTSNDGQQLQISASMARLLGLAEDVSSISLEAWLARVHAEDRAAITVAGREAFDNASPLQLDYRVCLPDGQIRSVRCFASTLRDARQCPFMDGIVLDITALKRMEHAINARDERLRDAQVAADLTVWELDVATQMYTTDAVRSTENRWRYGGVVTGITMKFTREQMASAYHPEDRQRSATNMDRCIAEQIPFAIELRRVAPDGSILWFESCGKPVLDEQGRTVKIRGISQNVTPRRRAEIELRAAEERLARAIRGTNDGLWEVELKTRRLWAAPRVLEMLGMSESASPFGLEDFQPLLPEAHLAVVSSAFAQHIEHQAVFDVEVEAQRADGELRWFRLRAACERDAAGVPLRMAGSVQDITEKKQYQRALLAATEAAAAASQAKSEFLANMSHEIRTPMNGVIGMTHLLLDTTLTPLQIDYASTIRDSAGALLSVINDILDFSKVEAGKLDLEHIDLDVRSTVTDVARLVAVQARAKGLQVTTTLDPALPQALRGDPGRLRQVLVNLCGNAVKFTQRGTIAIDVRLQAREAGSVVIRAAVRDTGMGIPADRLAQLFRPFTQVDSSTTRRFGGTGLGLSISRQLVELMGGECGVESELGSGSTFWFTVRLEIAAALPATTLPTPQARPQSSTDVARILIAEDNLVNQKVARATVERLGYRVDVCNNGHEAVAAWQAGRYRLILMDCQMPLMDGYEATREIRRREQGQTRIPIIALTAHAIKGADAECLAAGMDAHLSKPLERELLEERLRRFLREPSPDETPASTAAIAG
jgi:PAS domain S-box-containing protein